MNDGAVKYSNKLLAVKAYVGISRYLEHACLECVHWLKNWSSFYWSFFLLSDAGIAPYVEENDHVKLEQSSVQRLEPAPVYAVLDFITWINEYGDCINVSSKADCQPV